MKKKNWLKRKIRRFLFLSAQRNRRRLERSVTHKIIKKSWPGFWISSKDIGRARVALDKEVARICKIKWPPAWLKI